MAMKTIAAQSIFEAERPLPASPIYCTPWKELACVYSSAVSFAESWIQSWLMYHCLIKTHSSSPQTAFSVSHCHLAVDHSVVQYPVMKCVICMIWHFSAYLPAVLDKETGDRAVWADLLALFVYPLRRGINWWFSCPHGQIWTRGRGAEGLRTRGGGWAHRYRPHTRWPDGSSAPRPRGTGTHRRGLSGPYWRKNGLFRL